MGTLNISDSVNMKRFGLIRLRILALHIVRAKNRRELWLLSYIPHSVPKDGQSNQPVVGAVYLK